MSRAVARAALAGTLMAVVVAVIAGVLLATGVLPRLLGSSVPGRILVIVAAPDGEGALVGSIGMVLDTELDRPLLLDMHRTGVIEGTSANTPRGALPFGGGRVVATALAEQTGGQRLEWVVLKPAVWKALVDEDGGMSVTVPSEVSTYRDGRLTVLDAGRRKLSGDELEALLSATDFMGEEQEESVYRELGGGFSRVVGSESLRLDDLVASGDADSSMSSAQLSRFLSRVE